MPQITGNSSVFFNSLFRLTIKKTPKLQGIHRSLVLCFIKYHWWRRRYVSMSWRHYMNILNVKDSLISSNSHRDAILCTQRPCTISVPYNREPWYMIKKRPNLTCVKNRKRNIYNLLHLILTHRLTIFFLSLQCESWRHETERFPHSWPLARGIHRSLVDSLHKGSATRALMFPLTIT